MSKTTLDLSTLSDIADGAHTVTVKAKASGYNDSEFSNEVSYTKAASGCLFSEMQFITDAKTVNNGADIRFYNASNEEIAYVEFWWDKPNKVVKGRVNGGDTTDSIYNNGALRLSVNFKAVRCTVRPWGDNIRSAYAGYDFQDNRVSISIGQTTEVDVSNWSSTFAVSIYE